MLMRNGISNNIRIIVITQDTMQDIIIPCGKVVIVNTKSTKTLLIVIKVLPGADITSVINLELIQERLTKGKEGIVKESQIIEIKL